MIQPSKIYIALFFLYAYILHDFSIHNKKINLIFNLFKSVSIYLYSVHRIWIQLNFSLLYEIFYLDVL